LTAALQELGYQANPYEPCLFNRMVDGVQCSVCTYVDDLRWYSLNKDFLMADIAHLNKKFGVIKKLTLQDCNITEYLGMIWDRSTPGECRITFPKGIKQLLDMIEVKQTRATPGDGDLLKVDVDSKPLPEDRRQVFVSAVMKALDLAKHVRADILTASSFLAQRMTKATEEEWSKLTRRRMLEYVSGMKEHGLLFRPGKGLALTVHCDNPRSETGARTNILRHDACSTWETAAEGSTTGDARLREVQETNLQE
jgi:hypothetical protein